MENNYAKACKEVIEVLKHVSEDDIQKIPQEILYILEEKMDKNHEFYYNVNKEFEEQILLIETKAILANIFREYWATPEQKLKIREIQADQRNKKELKKQEMYNPNDLFRGEKK